MIRVAGTTIYVDTSAAPSPTLEAESRDALLLLHALTRSALGDTDVVIKALIPARLHATYDAAVARQKAAP